MIAPGRPPPLRSFHLCVDTFKAFEVLKIQSLGVKEPRWRSENKGKKCQSGKINVIDGEGGEFLEVRQPPCWLPAFLPSLDA